MRTIVETAKLIDRIRPAITLIGDKLLHQCKREKLRLIQRAYY